MDKKELVEAAMDVLENKHIEDYSESYGHIDYNGKMGSNEIRKLHEKGLVIAAIHPSLVNSGDVRIWFSDYEMTTEEVEITKTVERDMIDF